MIKKDVESDGQEGGKTGELQWQKCGKLEELRQKYRKYGLKKKQQYVEENTGENEI